MDLSKILDNYVGGQLEVQNPAEKYLYRGQIQSISFSNNEFYVMFDWLARGEGYPPLPKKWVKDYKTKYSANLDKYTIANVSNERIILNSSIVGETIVLFPKDGSKLNPENVMGLEERLD